MLRDMNAFLELAGILCGYGLWLVILNDLGAARSAMAEAISIGDRRARGGAIA